MPELPEVETVRRTLYGKLVGKVIRQIDILTPRQIYYPDAAAFRAELEGARFTDIGRRGKYLLLYAGHLTLISHLRMSGRLFVCGPEAPHAKHTHVIFHLEDGTELRYQDQRKFGGFHLLGPGGEGMPKGLASMGPEPLEAEFAPAYLLQALRQRHRPVKAVLLDQSVVAGLGNIYVDEALFGARIHPLRPASSLEPDEVGRLFDSIRSVLQKAILKRGTTFSLYLDGDAAPGDMYAELQVYDRAGLPCTRCGAPILKLAVAQRGTHLCPACQAAPADATMKPCRPRGGRAKSRAGAAAG